MTLCKKLLTIPVGHCGLKGWGGGILALVIRAGSVNLTGFKGCEHLEDSQCYAP